MDVIHTLMIKTDFIYSQYIWYNILMINIEDY